MANSDCIFCKIVAGDIPALRVRETADAIAFLDITPLAPGHTLLIPKHHVENLYEIPADQLAALTAHLPPLADAVRRATGATGLNLLQNNGASSGQAVFHLHFHLIPRTEGDALGYRWNTGNYAEGQAEQMRQAIANSLPNA